jgi:ribose 5-phosphate isomerase RpiB
MNNNTVLAIAFLIAGTLLTTTAITTIVPAAYADNKQKQKMIQLLL